MPSITFIDNSLPAVPADWLNVVDENIFGPIAPPGTLRYELAVQVASITALAAGASTAAATAQADADTALANAITASSNASAAQAAATTALAELADIASDNMLSQNEKPAVILDVTNITQEQAGIDAAASASGISSAAYDSAVTALGVYLAGLGPPVWNDLSSSTGTVIIGTTFRANFAAVYLARQLLLNAIAAYATSQAQTATTNAAAASAAASAAAANAATALAAAAIAQATAAAAISALAAISDDNILSKGEKPAVILDWTNISNEEPGIAAQGLAFGITSERTSYIAAYTALQSYLTSLSPAWNDTTLDTPIVGATFRSKFSDLYAARQILLNQIAAVAQGNAIAGLAAAAAAASAAAAAAAQAAAANAAIASIASDNVLSKGEKSAVILDWSELANSQAGLDAQAVAYGLSSAAFDSVISTLASYLGSLSPSWSDVTSDTPIIGTTFRTNFANAYFERQVLENAIANYAATHLIPTGQIVDNAITQAFVTTPGSVTVSGQGGTNPQNYSRTARWTLIASLTFVSPATCRGLLSCQANVHWTGNSGGFGGNIFCEALSHIDMNNDDLPDFTTDVFGSKDFANPWDGSTAIDVRDQIGAARSLNFVFGSTYVYNWYSRGVVGNMPLIENPELRVDLFKK